MGPKRNDSGAAAVEFALILPVLILLIGGIVDFGRAMYTEVMLTNASREGARTAIINEATLSDVRTRASAAPPAITVTTNATMCGGAGSSTTVTSSTPFNWVILGPALRMFNADSALPNSFSSQAVMRCS